MLTVPGTEGWGRASPTGAVAPPRAEMGNSHAKTGCLPLLICADCRIIVKLSLFGKEIENDQLWNPQFIDSWLAQV